MQVKIWKLPEDGITAGEQASTLAVLNVQSPRANSVKFHPTAENVTMSSMWCSAGVHVADLSVIGDHYTWKQ
jgi:hypothetical protein